MKKSLYPIKLEELQENIAEIFYFVKEQGELASGNQSRQKALGDTDETERQIHEKLLALGRKLMEQYFDEIGSGDTGYRIELNGQTYTRKHAQRPGSILTVFGIVPYTQAIYYSGDESSMRPFEVMANLPERKSTYFAQDLMARLGIEDTYSDSQEFYADFFGHSLSARTIEEVICKMSDGYDLYVADNPFPAQEDEREVGVVSFDGKGIRVIPAERTTGKTREALLGSIYTADRNVREAEKLAQSLIMPNLLADGEEDELQRELRPQNTTYFGSVKKKKDMVFEDVRQAADKRFEPLSISTVICLMDGALGLWNLAKKHFPNAVYILDIMHVLGYLWKAVNALESNEVKARKLVCKYLTMILRGQVGRVIGGLRIRLTKNNIQGGRKKIVQSTITYFENHRDYMRYDKYLLEGYPVASGVIESACRHLIQNRMERASAQWSILGAESVLKMRCVKANRDWALFQQMRKQQERERMYSEIIT